MRTEHSFYQGDSRRLSFIPSESVDLVVTSPPYPMIEMWDRTFRKLNPQIDLENGNQAYELMHHELDKVWKELFRTLKQGAMACINIGDATRTINGEFKLYPNHARIINKFAELGFSTLPRVLWRKQTNAPNKFMGSGMLPPGAYVTLEHETILIFRKGNKREFKMQTEKENRQESAYFWSERNQWFSDIWEDLKGTRQQIKEKSSRQRSGAFPFELPYRLINMFSVKGDTVLDPFTGTGTTSFAAACSERNSLGVEIDPDLIKNILWKTQEWKTAGNHLIEKRLNRQLEFVKKRKEQGKEFKYYNSYHNFPVVTRQEKNIKINSIKNIEEAEKNKIEITYSPPQKKLFL